MKKINANDIMGIFSLDVYESFDLEVDLFAYNTKDIFYIYDGNNNQLEFINYYHSEDNHDVYNSCKAGIVTLRDNTNEIVFSTLKSYRTNSGGGCGYNNNFTDVEEYEAGKNILVCDLMYDEQLYFIGNYDHKYYMLTEENIDEFHNLSVEELIDFMLKTKVKYIGNV